MGATIEISLSQPLFDQAETLAQRLDIPWSRLCEMALEDFIRHYPNQGGQDAKTAAPINQGDLYWVRLDAGIPHPHVVVQENVLNHSRIHTVVVCALTSNIQRASLLGNVLLEAGEANLPRQSVVEVSKVSTVDKAQLGEYIGALTEQRIQQILGGMRFLQASFFAQ